MRLVYRVLAYIVAVEVAIQASMVVWGDAGLGKWIGEGGVLDKSFAENGEAPFVEFIAFPIHVFNGMIGIPVFALLLLITSFWVRPPGVVKAAAIVVALVATQITLGILGHSVPLLGLMHGLNALLLFASALYAARRAARPAATIPAAAGDRTVTPV